MVADPLCDDAAMGTPAAWLDELSFDPGGPPWLSMGLSRVEDAGWLVPDDRRDAELAERHRLLAARHEDVFAAEPSTMAAGEEVRGLIRAWFAEHRPDLRLPEGRSTVACAVHPLEEAGRLVQEDLCLMVRHGEAHHLDAACLCFPSHWRLADKIGRPAAEMHGPVPRYDTELAARVDRYLERLRPGTISKRRNWSVHDSPELFAPWPPNGRDMDVDDVAGGLWLRSERQTLRRLPDTGAILFTIRVQQAPFGVLAARADVAQRLAARLEAQPPEVTEMNGLSRYLSAVLAWLGQVSGGRPSPPLPTHPG